MGKRINLIIGRSAQEPSAVLLAECENRDFDFPGLIQTAADRGREAQSATQSLRFLLGALYPMGLAQSGQRVFSLDTAQGEFDQAWLIDTAFTVREITPEWRHQTYVLQLNRKDA